MAAWKGGELGGEWTHVYVQLSPFTVHPIVTLLTGYTPLFLEYVEHLYELWPIRERERLYNIGAGGER